MAMPPPPSLLSFGGPTRTNRRAAGDIGVQRTNDDAQATKVSCAALGYFKDDLLQLLAKCLPSRKSPLINRGTWARHAAMRQVITDFVTACVQHAQQTQVQEQQQQQCQVDSTGTATATVPASSTAGSANTSSSASSSQVVCQVVVLGAGSDSSWFNLQQQRWPLLQAVHFIELDYHEMVSKKARTVLSTPQLLQLLPDGTIASTAPATTAAAAVPVQAHDNPGHATWNKQSATAPHSAQQQCTSAPQQPDTETGQGAKHLGAAAAAGGSAVSYGPVPPAAVANHVQELSGPQYSLVGADLRHIQQFEAASERAGFDPKLPTLYLSECVLIYMDPTEVQTLLAAAAQKAVQAGSSAALAIYEQTRPDDAFGVTMVRHLEARGCPLRSLRSVPTPASQQQRLLSTGWTAAAAADMAAVYYGSSSIGNNGSSNAAAQASAGAGGWLRPHWQAERQRIEQLELLDELEEWKLLQAHYCLAIGVTGEGASSWLAEGLQLQQLNALGS